MICSYRPGLRTTVSLNEQHSVLVHRRVNTMQVHSRATARKIAKYIRLVYGFAHVDDIILAQLAKRHQVHDLLIPVTVQHTRAVLEGMTKVLRAT